ncbi:VC0807 family protein [Nonomuraea insulae]|uniref:VC0807 family protein n=1 Tax=Nonomuraea insulae TaxID=1616787 RepID=A0ABW1CKF5_9ACTN
MVVHRDHAPAGRGRTAGGVLRAARRRAGQWTSLAVASLAPLVGIGLTWRRRRRLDPTALFMIAALLLSALITLITGDPRTLLARESWITGALGGWILASLAMTRPFLLDVAIKLSPPGAGERFDHLWQGSRIFHRWVLVASLAWGVAFLADAAARVAMAYTLPVDSVPLLGTVLLIVLIVAAQGLVMIHGRRTGAFAVLREHG